MIEALNIHVKGIVQGVGFRPFVYRAAKKHLVNGWVLNAIDGVSAQVDWEKKSAVVTLSKEVPDEVLKKAVEDADYKVVGIE